MMGHVKFLLVLNYPIDPGLASFYTPEIFYEIIMPALSKKFQIPISQLEDMAAPLFSRFEPWLNQFATKQISHCEVTGVFMILFYEMLYGERWFEGLQKRVQVSVPRESKIMIRDIFPEDKITKRIEKIADMNLAEFFIQCRIHKLPQTCQELMKVWFESDLPMRIEFEILSPMAMLEEQIQGRRVAWLPRCAEDLKVHHEGKDPLQFVLHDLEHAYNFFVKFPFEEQVQFYSELHKELSSGMHDARLSADVHFRNEIEYLISDMNSHPEHLRATFQALCVRSQIKSLSNCS